MFEKVSNKCINIRHSRKIVGLDINIIILQIDALEIVLDVFIDANTQSECSYVRPAELDSNCEDVAGTRQILGYNRNRRGVT